jgi:hypothetical protein
MDARQYSPLLALSGLYQMTMTPPKPLHIDQNPNGSGVEIAEVVILDSIVERPTG